EQLAGLVEGEVPVAERPTSHSSAARWTVLVHHVEALSGRPPGVPFEDLVALRSQRYVGRPFEIVREGLGLAARRQRPLAAVRVEDEAPAGGEVPRHPGEALPLLAR